MKGSTEDKVTKRAIFIQDHDHCSVNCEYNVPIRRMYNWLRHLTSGRECALFQVLLAADDKGCLRIDECKQSEVKE